MIENIIPAYLYTQYNDDADLNAFVDAYNGIAQTIYVWLRDLQLPIFVGGANAGKQLKWLVKGIYGEDVPILQATKRGDKGPYNTIEYNVSEYNENAVLYNDDIVTASDDLFKRVLTWNFYKADGRNFSVPWLKRRIMRFLNGVDGMDIANDQHWCVSVQFDKDGDGSIEIVINTNAKLNPNLSTPDSFDYAALFKGAMEGGILNMPYYHQTTVTIKE